VGHDVRSFADQLVAEGLLADAPADELPAGDVPAGGVPPTDLGESSLPLVYTPPAIERFDDLADLLLLDPIHEVTEPGWPAGRED
jgi:hypothetical protein